MIRGTTPHYSMRFTTDVSGWDTIVLTFSQGGNDIFSLNKSDMSFETVVESGTTYYCVLVSLTQEQTLSFSEKWPVEVEFRFASNNGAEANASSIKKTIAKRVLKGGVIR